jgi:BA14K-like protein
MIKLKVLSTAAAIALVAPMFASSASFAQERGSFGGGVGGMRAGGGAPSAAFGRSAVTSAPRFGGGSTGGRYAGSYQGGWNGGYRHHRQDGGYWPGAVAGAVVGGALASNYYYGSPYYGPGYYDDSYAYYDDDAPVAVEAAPGGDASYCAQRHRSYDPTSGTYLGLDGQRHPCP